MSVVFENSISPIFINIEYEFWLYVSYYFYSLGIVPHRHPITVVTGSPIEVKKVDNPTSEDINGLHQKYVEALKKLYATYNPIYGDDNIPLVIT